MTECNDHVDNTAVAPADSEMDTRKNVPPHTIHQWIHCRSELQEVNVTQWQQSDRTAALPRTTPAHQTALQIRIMTKATTTTEMNEAVHHDSPRLHGRRLNAKSASNHDLKPRGEIHAQLRSLLADEWRTKYRSVPSGFPEFVKKVSVIFTKIQEKSDFSEILRY